MRPFLLALCVLLATACSRVDGPAHAGEPKQAPDSPVRRCVNLGGGLEAPEEGRWGYTVRKEDLDRIAEAGFDTIRLPVRWSAHTDSTAPYRVDPAFMARVREIAGWAEEAGLRIIINVHHYDALMEDPDSHRPRLAAIWHQVSEAFADAPDSVIFELLNEPKDRMTVRKTDAVNRELLDIIREQNPDRWVVVGSAGWGGLGALLKSRPPGDDRIILTFHTYEPYNFTHQGAFFADPPPPTGTQWGTPKEYQAMRQSAGRAADFAIRTGHPMLLGEFGVFEEVPLAERVKWTRAVRETAEDHNFGWCYWDFSNAFKIYNGERETWIHSMLNALIDD